MKKKNNKILLFTIFISLLIFNNKLSFSQIITYDFAGNVGNETTDTSNYNDPRLDISIISRGATVTAANNTDRYNATNWTSSTSPETDDYLEFNISPLTGKKFSITSITINHQRSSTGPKTFTLRYSEDGYSSDLGGGPYTIPDVITTQTTTYTLSITDQTTAITFRIYGYNAESGAGSWGPGDYSGNDLIINGSTNEINPYSTNSDIIADPAFSYSSNINYQNYLESDLTSASLSIGQFKIRDGGGSPDGDSEPTTLTSLTFSVQNYSNLYKIALYDGTNEIEEQIATSVMTFDSLNIIAADDNEKVITIKASFYTSVVDNQQIQMTITNANADISGSIFTDADAGGSYTSVSGDNNRIEVTADRLGYVSDPISTVVNRIMVPSVMIQAQDQYSNTDKDFTGNIKVTSTGTLSGTPVIEATSDGIATFATLTHTVIATNLTLTAERETTNDWDVTSVPFDITLTAPPIVISFGDIAIVGISASTTICSGNTGADEISFFCFKDIPTDLTLDFTDNGWERCNPGRFGDGEGAIRATRTGDTIDAGTVITFRNNGSTTWWSVSPDTNWTFSSMTGGSSSLNMNSSGDQLFIMSGGYWNDPDGPSVYNHNVTYDTGIVLFGFNTKIDWIANCAVDPTKNSNLYPGLDCFNMAPNIASDYLKYTGPTTPATQRTWIARINNSSNWSSFEDCALYEAGAPDYAGTYSFDITTGGFSEGKWLGAANHNWFLCNNWESMHVPDSTVNVTIPSGGISNNPIIDSSGAECKTLTINGSILEVNDTSSTLDIYGNFTNNAVLKHIAGDITFRGNSNKIITGTNNISFYNLNIDNGSSYTITLYNDINIDNILSLSSGTITTGSNHVNIELPAPGAITNHGTSSYIIGNLKRKVNATGSYDLPVGYNNYEFANITLNSSSGITYLNASFTSPINGNPPSGIYVSGTEINAVLDAGFWTIFPDAMTSVDYNITLTSIGHSNGGTDPADHTIIKRTNSFGDWSLEGNHDNATQSGTGTNPITAVRTNITSFSDFAIGKSTLGPLPVELIDFEAKCNNKTVSITWKTASETNCKNFTLEKSTDGVNYIFVNNINAEGNSNTLKTYFYNDAADSKPQYYRIYSTDYNNNVKYYHPVIVNCNTNDYNEFEIISINQCNDKLVILYNISQNDDISCYLFNIHGQKIEHTNTQANSGVNSITIPFQQAEGIYFLTLISSDGVISEKILLH